MAKNSPNLLDSENWVHYKLYRSPRESSHWKLILDWYHKVLREIVRPLVDSTADIESVLFGIYSPGLPSLQDKYDRYTQYETADKYERRIRIPEANVIFIRLRLYADPTHRKSVSEKLKERIEANKILIWDFEILRDYKVMEDLGNRYGRRSSGSIDEDMTVHFIRYWDAACRYILSILIENGNWNQSVDVWGIPHKLNNSLGGWLRFTDAKCPKCGKTMYMATGPIPIPQSFLPILSKFKRAPIFILSCPDCNMGGIAELNI
ncbi:MAG: hypothetical protein QG670_538 [Thermoproteota archaeon]|nr:hypothetical protein [Thermoproteota archaeon]